MALDLLASGRIRNHEHLASALLHEAGQISRRQHRTDVELEKVLDVFRSPDDATQQEQLLVCMPSAPGASVFSGGPVPLEAEINEGREVSVERQLKPVAQ